MARCKWLWGNFKALHTVNTVRTQIAILYSDRVKDKMAVTGSTQ